MSAPIPLILDSDGCITSCDALWWALTSTDIDVVAVTCAPGVVSARQGAANFARVLAAAGRTDIPLAVGLEDRLGSGPEIPSPAGVHGDDGLGNTPLPRADLEPVETEASELMSGIVRSSPHELTIAALGPFTNIGRMVERDPELATLVRDLHVMGGVVRPPGNAMPFGEMNFVFDPAAAAAMVLAPWARPPLLVPLDVTHQATLTEAEFAVLNARETPQADFMAEPFAFYRQLGGVQARSGVCPSHDTLAAMTVVHPELVVAPELPIAVDRGGDAAWGASVVDLRALDIDLSAFPEDVRALAEDVFYAGKGRWRIALEVDVDAFRRRIRAFYGA